MNDIVRNAVSRLAELQSPSPTEVEASINAILNGDVEPVLISAFLMGLRMKGESVDDITAAATVMRRHAHKLPAPADAVDTCGTGGLGWTTLNTSTASAIVAAAAGAKITKHGNRSVPPKTGSADVLEKLEVNLKTNNAQYQQCLDEAGVAFMFAQTHHSAMKNVAPVRKMLGLRTIFNLIGPLSNPAGAKRQVLGVFSKDWVEPLAEVLQRLGTEKAWVVHGDDGLDELTVSSYSTVAEVTPQDITLSRISPEDVGLRLHDVKSLAGGTPEFNAEAISNMLDGQPGAFRDIVALNAGAALYVGDVSQTLELGVQQCLEAIDNGQAKATLDCLIKCSNGNSRI